TLHALWGLCRARSTSRCAHSRRGFRSSIRRRRSSPTAAVPTACCHTKRSQRCVHAASRCVASKTDFPSGVRPGCRWSAGPVDPSRILGRGLINAPPPPYLNTLDEWDVIGRELVVAVATRRDCSILLRGLHTAPKILRRYPQSSLTAPNRGIRSASSIGTIVRSSAVVVGQRSERGVP